MAFKEEGIDFSAWSQALASAPEGGDIDLFIERMKRINLANSVFVDCTASEAVAARYAAILNASIAVVTPNKRVQSGKLQHFDEARSAQKKRAVPFLYEASVGAGLPVIGTLQDLLKSGDEVWAIEAVLSGTLSFLFNSFDGTKPFSELVSSAVELGLTEPHPREDLSGRDVGRKILTLARVMKRTLELEDAVIEDLVPPDCRESRSVEEFISKLAAHDQEFETKRRDAEGRGRKLRYIAVYTEGKLSAGLQEVEADHPFFRLSGSDNMIVFRTKRYWQRPLVVQGPGAGAEVTSAAVFADIIRVADYMQQRL